MGKTFGKHSRNTIERSEDMLNVSKSSISMFESCPYSFYLHKIEGIKTKSSPIMLQGIKTHEMFKEYFDNLAGKELTLETINEIPELQDEEDLLQMSNFKNFNLRKWSSLKNPEEFMPIVLEERLESNYNSTIRLAGVIDRVDKMNDQIFLIDYKTGRRLTDISEHLQELSIYDELLRKAKNIIADVYGIYHSRYDMFTRAPADHSYFNAFVEPTILEIERCYKENDWVCDKHNCRFCLMNTVCDKVKA
jgi:hypothetical protein